MPTIEHVEECKACSGTGLYVGMAERDGTAVVCNECKGSGAFKYKHTYKDFTERHKRDGVCRVLQVNPGICVGNNIDKGLTIEAFGGLSYAAWLNGSKFKPGTEMRLFTCPAWWYQSADYDKKPQWDECIGCGSFSRCSHFNEKHLCWRRWDKENA